MLHLRAPRPGDRPSRHGSRPARCGPAGPSSSGSPTELAADEETAGLPATRPPDPAFVAPGPRLGGGRARWPTVLEDEELSGGDFVRNVKQLIDLLRQVGDVAPERPRHRAPRRDAGAPTRSTPRRGGGAAGQRYGEDDDRGRSTSRGIGAGAAGDRSAKGEAWGEPGGLPAGGVVVPVDAEAASGRRPRARRAGEPVPPLGLLGGDLCRTLGGTGDEGRLRSDAGVAAAGRPRRGARRRPAALVRRPPRGAPGLVAGPGRGGDERAVPRATGTWRRGATPTTVGSTSSTPTPACARRAAARSGAAARGAPTCRTRASTRAPARRAGRARRADARLPRRRAPRGGPAPVDPGRARRPRLRRLGVRRRARAASGGSPCQEGTERRQHGCRGRKAAGPPRYRRRPCRPGSSTSRPAPTARASSTTRRSGPTTCGCARWRSALNHMDLWVTRGRPTPARCRTCPAATWPASSRRSGSRSPTCARRRRGRGQPGGVAARGDRGAAATTRRSAAGFQILGEQRWGGHAELVVVPAAQRRAEARPAASWEECAAYPLATLTAWRMLRAGPAAAAGERC